MIKNYFKIALRTFWKHKLFSAINLAGLAIGISAALVIYLIVQYEFSFDTFHKDRDRIYRVTSVINFPDLVIHNSGVPVPTVQATRNEVTGLEAVSYFRSAYEEKVAVPFPGSKTPAIYRKQKDIVYADAEYFKLFNYQWLAGSPKIALKDPFQVVLTESRAKTYFSAVPPAELLGRQIIYDDTVTVTVSGIVKDFDRATDFTFKEFISMATVEQTALKDNMSWGDWGSITSSSQMFVKLAPGTSTKQIETQLVALRNKYRGGKDKKDDTHHALQPLADIHFNPDYDAFDQRQANKNTLYGLLAVALFLLLLGCINFINLTTAQSINRAKEIGIRKTMGSSKIELISQFLSETFVVTLFATALSVAITPWLLKMFGDFIPAAISFGSLNQPHVWIFLGSLVIVVSVLSGFYPALVLTKFQPVTALKNQAFAGSSKTRKTALRKTLTVIQFVIAQFLIIATLIVTKQIHYSLNKDLGYKRDAIVHFDVPWNFFSNKKDDRRFVLYDKIKNLAEIEMISLAGNTPASEGTSSTRMKVDNGKKIIETMVEVKSADTAYFKLYHMKMLAGRNLLPSDTTKEYVINESYARFLGFQKPEEAIGKFVDKNFKVPIVGVLADFHTKSTHDVIKPLAFSAEASNSYHFHIALRARGNDPDLWKRGLAKIEKAYKQLYPEDDFSYEFFDATIAGFYKNEQNVSRLLKWSTALCIFISCLGLLGLVIYTTNTRIKEIGVRKVSGASIVQIVSLLSKDFLSLVLIAFLITAPLAWWAMHSWLDNFAYRTSMSWWVFAVCGVSMLVLALFILSIRTIKAALENPVRSLRSE